MLGSGEEEDPYQLPSAHHGRDDHRLQVPGLALDLEVGRDEVQIGVEIGQLGFVAILLIARESFKVLEFRPSQWAAQVPAYIIGSLGVYWMIDRIMVAL